VQIVLSAALTLSRLIFCFSGTIFPGLWHCDSHRLIGLITCIAGTLRVRIFTRFSAFRRCATRVVALRTRRFLVSVVRCVWEKVKKESLISNLALILLVPLVSVRFSNECTYS
jgi:hypothetical protein